MKGEPINVIIVEHDVDDPFRSSGAIIMEQYTRNSPEEVRERARMMASSGKYGRVWVAELKEPEQVHFMSDLPPAEF